MAWSDYFKVFGFGEAVVEWFENRPFRLKEKALEAATYYMEIDTHKTYKGRPVGIVEASDLKKHLKKRFDAWKDGV
jgi:hypothetical protein